MINPSGLLEVLARNKIRYFVGVPDSLLSSLCSKIEGSSSAVEHMIAPNEGTAVAIAIGFHLASGDTPAVYMQNSGLGNAYNPLISLAHQGVYGIPMLLIIGWRGAKGHLDEPQHVAQGVITPMMLELAGINTFVIDEHSQVDQIEEFLRGNAVGAKGPYALLVSPDVLEKSTNAVDTLETVGLTREAALTEVINSLPDSAIVVATTGKLSRELYEYRINTDLVGCDFLTVGGMGHASAIALGIAKQCPKRTVVCLDGDGAFQMHLGVTALIGECSPSNFVHVLFNNGIHESVGGQKIAATGVKYEELIFSLNYKSYDLMLTTEEIASKMSLVCKKLGPNFVEIKVNSESRKDLKRPKSSPEDNKVTFQNYVLNQESKK
jgi:phosphonopyruvate decarboxylase